VRDTDKQTQLRDTASAYGLGFELVCAVAGFVLVGVWIDRHYSSGPWGTLICLVLGLIGGLYNLFRGVSRLGSGAGQGGPRGADRGPGSTGTVPRAPATGGSRTAGQRDPDADRARALDPQPDPQAGSEIDRAVSPGSTGATGSTGAKQ
jgi:F0F1-type ATP synthase assembly protein I